MKKKNEAQDWQQIYYSFKKNPPVDYTNKSEYTPFILVFHNVVLSYIPLLKKMQEASCLYPHRSTGKLSVTRSKI